MSDATNLTPLEEVLFANRETRPEDVSRGHVLTIDVFRNLNVPQAIVVDNEEIFRRTVNKGEERLRIMAHQISMNGDLEEFGLKAIPVTNELVRRYPWLRESKSASRERL